MAEGILDALIIGGGPAGLSAGIYLSRAGWRCRLFERDVLGGQARHIERIENYPGFPQGVSGKRLMRLFTAQARRWKLPVTQGTATKITAGAGGFRVDAGGAWHRGKAVILCPGALFKNLGLAGEKPLRGKGVFHCAFESAREFLDEDVAVVGGGDVALHQALLLSRHARRVYLIHRSGGFRAIARLQKKIRRRANVEIVLNARVRRLSAAGGRLRGLELAGLKAAERRRLRVTGLFVLIGKRADRSLAWAKPRAGLFTAGDGRPGNFRQVSIAAGDGIRAAMECERHLLRL